MAQLRHPSSPKLPDGVLDDVVRIAKEGPLPRAAAGAPDLGDFSLTEAQLADLRMPVRLVWGVADQLMPVAYAQSMLAALPDGAYIPLETCGHIPQQEAPGRFLEALEQALGA